MLAMKSLCRARDDAETAMLGKDGADVLVN